MVCCGFVLGFFVPVYLELGHWSSFTRLAMVMCELGRGVNVLINHKTLLYFCLISLEHSESFMNGLDVLRARGLRGVAQFPEFPLLFSPGNYCPQCRYTWSSFLSNPHISRCAHTTGDTQHPL